MARQRSIRAGRAFVELSTDDSKLTSGLRKAQGRLRAFGRTINAIGVRVGAAGAAITGPLLAASGVFASVGDDLDKMSARTGVSVERLQQLGFAAQQSGSDIDALAGVIRRMNRRLGRGFAEGGNSQTEAMEKLGVDLERLRGMDPEGRLLAIADAMANYGDDAAAAGLAQRAFGAEVDKVLPMLLQGRDGIEAMAARAADLNLVMSEDGTKAAAGFTDRLSELRAVLRQVWVDVGAVVADALSPYITAIAEAGARVVAFIRDNGRLVSATLTLGAALLAGSAALLAVGLGAQLAGFALGGFILIATKAAAVVGLLTAALGLAISVKGQVVAAIVAVGVALLNMTSIGNQAVQWLSDRFTWLWTRVKEVVAAIGTALQAGGIQEAMDVVSAALRVAWVKLTDKLRSIWQEFLTWMAHSVNDIQRSVMQTAIEWVTPEGPTRNILLREINDDHSRIADAIRMTHHKAADDVSEEYREALKQFRDAQSAALELGLGDEPQRGDRHVPEHLMDSYMLDAARDATRSATQAGLFNIRALAGLQTSPDDRVVRELRQHTEQNRALLRLARERGMVFGG